MLASQSTKEVISGRGSRVVFTRGSFRKGVRAPTGWCSWERGLRSVQVGGGGGFSYGK